MGRGSVLGSALEGSGSMESLNEEMTDHWGLERSCHVAGVARTLVKMQSHHQGCYLLRGCKSFNYRDKRIG